MKTARARSAAESSDGRRRHPARPVLKRLILAEVCATRKEVEALLGAISDLNDRDIHRARSDADLLRRALVEERILELKQAEGGPANA